MNALHASAFEAAKKLPPELVNEWLSQTSKVLAEGKASDALQGIQAEVALAFCENSQAENPQEK